MDLYNVNKYTDEQLYDILDISHPTDRELEAKIIQMIHKYEDIPTDIGKQLYDFFNNIYKRFFETDSDDDEEENIIEGMTNPTEPPLTSGETSAPTNSIVGYQPQNISSVQQFDYSPDKLQLNPLLKQTIKRVISIDSQYRNITTDPSTSSFSFDLSEPLRDVVSLKLYSIQIPYTWYTVGKSYGSNFFYLRGSTTGVSNYNYQIKIPPGNYDQTTLPATLNSAFQDISNNAASDINFNGLSLITYNQSTTKTTVQLNIQNTFNETYYNLSWFLTPPTNVNTNYYSIPGYIGFNNQTYALNTITSNQSYYLTSIITTQYNQNYTLDNSNNYFTVIQYLGYNQQSGYDSRSTILNTITLQLTNNGFPYTGFVTRQNIIDAVNQAINTSNLFDTGSQIQRIDITDPTKQNYKNSYYQLSLTLNRFKTKYVPNAKVIVIFPNETVKLNQYGEPFTIWQYQPKTDYSAFYFDNTANELSQLTSESPAINSTFTVDLSTNIYMTCTTPTYNNSLNDFSMNIQGGTYTLTQYLSAINTSFAQQNTNGNIFFNTTNTISFIDINNRFNLQVDLTKTFTNKAYKLVIDGNSFLTHPKNPNGSPNFDCSFSIVNTSPSVRGSTNLFDISYININIPKLTNGYTLDTSCVFIIKPDYTTYGNSGNGSANPVVITLPTQQFGTYQDITQAIQTAIITTPVSNGINTQTPLSRSSFNINTDTNVDISLNLVSYYYLGEANYKLAFYDNGLPISDTNNSWNRFNIDSSYNLSQNITGGFALITGYTSIGSISKQLNIIDNCNNTITFNTNGNPNSPNDSITISIAPGSYTIGTLYSELNTALSKNPKTYGSYFKQIIINNQEYTQIWLNINRVFTTQDYILDFYDPVNFVSCYAGSKSVQNTTWDTTIGWILGFRDYTQYFLTTQNQTQATTPYYLSSANGSYYITQNIDSSSNLLVSSPVFITGDTTLSTNLYNYFLISLDDFIQNHLNDGLVTITRSQTAIQIPDYAYTTTQSCDPATGNMVSTFTSQPDSNNVTNAQLYALNQSITSQQNPSKQYSPGPFIKDLFGIIPYKPPKSTGDYFTEFGGTLQNQERLYFGPVNIRKMAIQLLTDRGTQLDLNGSNWSFSFVCEQLYRASSS